MQIVGQTWLNLVTWTCWSWRSVWLIFHGTVGHCDPYFMVQWFCLISWRLFDVWTSLFGIIIQYDQTFDLKVTVGHCDLYFMVQWFCIISWKLFDIWKSYFGIMGQMFWPQNKYRSLWPIFHGPVILPYISKTIWWMSVIFSDIFR